MKNESDYRKSVERFTESIHHMNLSGDATTIEAWIDDYKDRPTLVINFLRKQVHVERDTWEEIASVAEFLQDLDIRPGDVLYFISKLAFKET